MNGLYFGLGTLALVGVAVDLLWTTLWVEGGAGPLTTRLMRWSWKGLRRATAPHSRVLSLAGPFILVFTTVAWLVLIWGGWTLVFASAERTLIDTVSKNPITWTDRIYFTGYTVFTLGIGDYVPRDGVWQVATAMASGSGMLFVTLSITYILSVLDAVSQKRAFATGVTGLGTQSDKIIQRGWNGESFDGLDLPFNTLTAQLNTLTANHKAYPILHYFYTPEVEQAPTISIAILDDALTMLRFGIPESDRPDRTVVESARSSVRTYLETLDPMIPASDRTPPPPDLDALPDEGIPTVSAEEFDKSLDELRERRRKLLALVELDARQWPELEER